MGEPIYHLLTTGSAFKINNLYNVCTLGHGLNEPIVYHKYLGDRQKIINDLQEYQGFHNGLVVLDQNDFLRDADNMICMINSVDNELKV